MTELLISTQRLRLRRLRQDDAAALSGYRCLPEVAKYQSWTSFDISDANQLISDQQFIQLATPGSWTQLMIVLADSDEPIGDCGIHFLENAHDVELGITLNPGFQRSGIASEAIEAVLSYLFDHLNVRRVTATTDAENAPAQRLFQRLGFRQEAHFIENVWFKGSWGSELHFAMLQSEWRDRALRPRFTLRVAVDQ